MSWENVEIGSVTDFSNGFAFKSKFFTDNKSDIPLVKGENLGKGEVLWEDSKYWRIDMTIGIEKFFLNPNDLILAMDRPYVGGGLKFAMIKEESPRALQVQRIGRLVAKEEKVIPLFLKYVIGSVDFLHYIKNTQGGVGVPHISPAQIKRFQFNLPPLQTQKRIASILSAYDDLIENNLKRIKLLEETAQNIYKEWFVNFRFPNYEHTPINQETGLPEGWEIKPLNEYVDFKEGPGLRNWQFKDEGIPFLNIRMMGEGELDFSSVKYLESTEVEAKYSHFLLSEFDHIVSTSGTLGKVVTIRQSHLPLCLNTSIIRMRPLREEIGKWQLRELIKSPEFLNLMKSFATGSAQLNFGPKHLNMLTLNVPSVQFGESFERMLNPIEEQICELMEFNQKLKEARDILLPRLMNRTIEV